MRQLRAGVYLQEAFPFLSAGEREFILSGITPDEWAEIFPKEGEDEE